MLRASVALTAEEAVSVGGAPVATQNVCDSSFVQGPSVPSRDVWLFNRVHLSRCLLGELPLPLAGHALAALGGTVWVFGGFSSERVAPRALMAIRLRMDNSEALAPRVIAIDRVDVYRAHRVSVFASSARVRDGAIFWGGFSTVANSDLRLAPTNIAQLLCVDADGTPSLQEVCQSLAVPSPRAAASMCFNADSDVIYMCGGTTGGTALHDVHVGAVVFPSSTTESMAVTWRAVDCSLAVPRFGHAACFDAARRRIIVAGGFAAPGASTATAENEAPSQATRLWALTNVLEAMLLSERGDVRKMSPPLDGEWNVDPSRDAAVAFTDGLLIDACGLTWHETSAIEATSRTPRASPSSTVVSSNTDVALQPHGTSAEVEFHLADAPKGVGEKLRFPRGSADVELFRRSVLELAGVPADDHENGLVFTKRADGDLHPLHLAGTLAHVTKSAPDIGPIALAVLVEHPPKHYQVTHPAIGQGSFGTVYRAINTADNRSFCLKRVSIDPSRGCSVEELTREIRMMRHLRHPNLVRYLGSKIEAGRKMYIFMEFVTGDTLAKTCKSIPMTNRQVQLCVRQVLLALEYLHSFSVVHRDIKGANVLFDADGRVKVSDFGTAKYLNPLSQNTSNRPAGTILFMAPEVMSAQPTSTAADIWSLGCLVIEMVSGQLPYSERGFTEGLQIVNAVCNQRYAPKIPERLTPDGIDFVRQCLNFDPSRRPSCSQLLRHRFITTLEPDGPSDAAITTAPTSGQALFPAVDTLQTDASMLLDEQAQAKETRGLKPTKIRRPGR